MQRFSICGSKTAAAAIVVGLLMAGAAGAQTPTATQSPSSQSPLQTLVQAPPQPLPPAPSQAQPAAPTETLAPVARPAPVQPAPTQAPAPAASVPAAQAPAQLSTPAAAPSVPQTPNSTADANPEQQPSSDAQPPATPVDATPAVAGHPAASAAATLPKDLSPWGMFLAADIVVKLVMIGLAFASVLTWTIWFAKAIEFVIVRRKLRRSIGVLGQARSLAECLGHLKPGSAALTMAREADKELRLSADAIEPAGVKERVASRLTQLQVAAARRITRGTGMLATIGATAPFVGLFGTVWGIMNSFIGISKQQTTNLAVVAPGIAEALLATALGLVAAIPAVVLYNMFSRWVSGYRALYAEASNEVERLVSRDLDRMMRGLQNGLQNGLQSGLQDDRPIRRNIAAE